MAKLNFDHALADAFLDGDWHGWYNLPYAVKNWECPSGDTAGLTFTLQTHGTCKIVIPSRFVGICTSR